MVNPIYFGFTTTSGSCHWKPESPLVCGGQPLSETVDWGHGPSCCCFKTPTKSSSNYWQAEFSTGFVTIDYIEFLPRNAIAKFADDILISVHTLSGWEHCDTTSGEPLG